MKQYSTKSINLGGLSIGGAAPVRVQSMTNTDTRDPAATLAQIQRLAAKGCEAVRVAVPDMAAAQALAQIVDNAKMPVIADIHFDWRLAIRAMEAGCAGIRINPGNIGNKENIFKIIDAARIHQAVIRIGVNSGSLEKDLLQKYYGPTPEALAQSALRHVRLMEDRGFDNIKISIKSSSVPHTVQACRRLAALCCYPQHIGITEAGTLLRGAVKSSIGLGMLLAEGIGATMRVSLTAPPEQELDVAWEILRALGLRRRGPEIISCPTCGRTEIDLFNLVNAVEKALENSTADIKVAVMGCPVNGPGEAREADIGIAGGKNRGIVFRKGKIIAGAKGQEQLLHVFMQELDKLLNEADTKGKQ